MTSVYTGYLWKCGRLKWTARDIVAQSNEQAAKRVVHALRKRPGLGNDLTLRALNQHLHGHRECPEGVTLQVVKEVNKPKCDCVTFG